MFKRAMTKKGRQDFGRQVGHIGRQVSSFNKKILYTPL